MGDMPRDGMGGTGHPCRDGGMEPELELELELELEIEIELKLYGFLIYPKTFSNTDKGLNKFLNPASGSRLTDRV